MPWSVAERQFPRESAIILSISFVGQGQPEVGEIPKAPPRINSVSLEELIDAAYGPVGGTPEVRAAVADWINRTYRRGLKPYSVENISFASGGRLALTRLFSIFIG